MKLVKSQSYFELCELIDKFVHFTSNCEIFPLDLNCKIISLDVSKSTGEIIFNVINKNKKHYIIGANQKDLSYEIIQEF